MTITGFAQTGLRASQNRLTASASRVAGGAAAKTPADYPREAVEQMAAVQDFRANVKVIAAADAMTRSTLELWG